MSENEIRETEEVATNPEPKPTEVIESPKKSPLKLYVGAALIVAVIILGVLYNLEKEGRSSTTIFSSMIESQADSKVVAVVDGEEILNKDLDTGVEQFKQMALAQGVDVEDAEVQKEMRSQALDVLINTRLLIKEAEDRGISVSDEDTEARVEAIKTEIGGEEVLTERMESLGIDEAKLYKDVREELLIQALLDQLFAEANIEVTDEEVAELYENAGSGGAELPPLETVSEQIKAEISSGKEQVVIDELLVELRDASEVVIEGE